MSAIDKVFIGASLVCSVLIGHVDQDDISQSWLENHLIEQDGQTEASEDQEVHEREVLKEHELPLATLQVKFVLFLRLRQYMAQCQRKQSPTCKAIHKLDASALAVVRRHGLRILNYFHFFALAAPKIRREKEET